jgi:serine/threonine protein kinase
VQLFAPLLDGLAVVHAAGYLHRDIKPDNIYVRDSDGSLVAARLRRRAPDREREGRDRHRGDPGYGPIEQYAGGGRQGPWTDLYALGATLFWLVTGKKPIEAPGRLEDPDPLPAAELLARGKYSPEFLCAIDWALKMHPAGPPAGRGDVPEGALLLARRRDGIAGSAAQGRRGRRGRQRRGWAEVLTTPRLLRARAAGMWRALVRPASWPIAVKMTLAMVATALLPMMITAYYNLQKTQEHVAAVELSNLEQLA